MKGKIDDDFIAKWHANYNEGDDDEYDEIIILVKNDIENKRTISLSIFERIYKWKTRGRSKGRVNTDFYKDIYAENIKIALELPKNKKIYLLNGMPGVRIPVGSTILHFIYPNTFPIIDERTIKTLQFISKCNLKNTKRM